MRGWAGSNSRITPAFAGIFHCDCPINYATLPGDESCGWKGNVQVAVQTEITPTPVASTRGNAYRPTPLQIFLLFTAAYFLSYFFRTANAIIAGDLARDLTLDAGQLGLMTSLFFGAFALAQIPLGIGLDRWGARVVVPAMMAIAVIGALVFAIAPSFGPLALGRALIGAGMAAILPSAFKTFGAWFPSRRVATMSALLVGIGASGALFAATPLAWLTAQVGWRVIFVGAAVAVAISALAITRWARNAPTAVPSYGGTTSAGGFRVVLRDRRFWRIVPLNFFFTGIQLGVQGLWGGPYLFDVVGLRPIEAGNILLLLSGGVCIGSALSGWLTDRWGVARTIATSAALFTLCQFGLIARPPLALVGLLYLGFGLTGSFCIMGMAHARQIFPKAITGQAVAAMNFFGIGGSFCIQWWMGLIIKRSDADTAGHYPPLAYSVAFGCAAIGMILALLWYLPLVRETTQEQAC